LRFSDTGVSDVSLTSVGAGTSVVLTFGKGLESRTE
jgi:hypothetical protein